MTHPKQSPIEVSYMTDLCQRSFPHREEQQIRDVEFMGAWQHQMTSFTLDWYDSIQDKWYSEPLILRRIKSQISWWQVDDRNKARREVTVMRWLHDRGIPVPSVYATESGPYGDVMLETRIPGVIWFDISANFEKAILPYIDEYARLLARVHNQEVPHAVKQVMPHVTLMSVLETLYRWAQHAGDENIQNVIKQVAPHAMNVPESEPCVLHGDYHFANILLDEGNIQGIIDWEFAAYGDPRWDVVSAYQLLIEFEASSAANRFLDTYITESGRNFEGPPMWNVVVPLQAWALSAWLREEVIQGRKFGFRMADVLGDQYDEREARAMAALTYLG